MTPRRHLYALAAALMAFGILTVMSGAFGLPVLVAFLALSGGCTALYFHYRRRSSRAALIPVTPARDDRVIPQDVKIAVSVRDKGLCQLRYPGICLVDKQICFDHVFPYSLGGSSKDENNIQLACKPCNLHKGARVPV